MMQSDSDHRPDCRGSDISSPGSPAVSQAILQALAAAEFSCAGQSSQCSIIHISPEFTRLTGYESAETAGKRLQLLYGSRTDPAVVRSLGRAMSRAKCFQGELLLYRKDGRPFWCWLLVAPVLDSGSGASFAGALVDISTRKEQEEHLQVRESTYRGIFANSVEGIYQSTPDGTYLEVNPALARMYGYESPDQLLNQVQDIQQQIYVDPTMREKFKNEIERTDVVRGLEYQVRRREGRIIWISESARVVRDHQGRIRYYEGFIEEITQRKQAEAALKSSQQQLIETSREVGMAEVATGVLHNMGNALNSINVSVTVIAEKLRTSRINGVARASALMEANQSQLADFITTDPKGRQLPKYLSALGEHLLNEHAAMQEELARLRKGLDHVSAIVAMQQNYAKASNTVEKIDPVELIEDALKMSNGSLSGKDLEIVRRYEPGLPEVTVSKHAVLQILINLIRNAQKACEGTGAHPKRLTLRVVTSHEGRFMRVEVSDNGVGIPEANLTRIFNHGFTTRSDGHGFGLHSGAMLAKQLGGSLSAFSEGPGKGATFMLEFPCQPAEPTPQK